MTDFWNRFRRDRLAVYSLGVIAYQMLSGDTPFRGDFTRVMESHKLFPPPPLDAKKVRKKLKRVINSALAKQPENRPQTAEAFASALRSRSEGIFGLLRRAGMIYTDDPNGILVEFCCTTRAFDDDDRAEAQRRLLEAKPALDPEPKVVFHAAAEYSPA